MNDLMQQVMQDYGQYMGAPSGLNDLKQRYEEGGKVSPLDEALAQRQAVNQAIAQRLMSDYGSTVAPSESEKWLRLSAAFANPGKTGNFFESLGTAADTLAEHRKEVRQARALNEARDLQRLQTMGELSTQQYQLIKDAETRKLLQKYLLADGAGEGAAAPGSGAGAGVKLPPAVSALVAAGDTDKAVDTIVKLAIEQGKPTDIQRNLAPLVASGKLSQEDADAIILEASQPKFEMVDVPTPRGTVKMPASQARQHYNKPAATGQAQEAAPTAPTAPVTPMTVEESAAQGEALKERAKADVEAGQALVDKKSFAKSQMDAAEQVMGLTKTNPKAFGVLAKPGVATGFAALIEKGVQTPFGQIGVSLQEPISKFTLSDPDLQAQQLAVAPILAIEIGFRKLFLKGEGPVSNMEGALVSQMGPQLIDNPDVAYKKAGIIRIRAEKDEAVATAYEKYRESNPTAGPSKFYQTPEYKEISDRFDDRYRKFAIASGIKVDVKSGAKPKAASGTGSGKSLMDQLKAEREKRSKGAN